MSFNIDSIEAAVAEARSKGTERGIKFEQSFDIAVNFRSKELDVSKPENRLNQELTLPNALYPPAKVCAFGDGEFAEKKDITITTRTQADINTELEKTLELYLGKKPFEVPLEAEFTPVHEELLEEESLPEQDEVEDE